MECSGSTRATHCPGQLALSVRVPLYVCIGNAQLLFQNGQVGKLKWPPPSCARLERKMRTPMAKFLFADYNVGGPRPDSCSEEKRPKSNNPSYGDPNKVVPLILRNP